MTDPTREDPDDDEQPDQPLNDEVRSFETCPRCESPDIRRFPKLAFAAAGIALALAFDWTMSRAITEVAGIGIGIVVLLTIILDRWRCNACGLTWK